LAKKLEAGSESSHWLTQLTLSERREKNWHKAGDAIVARYRDEQEEHESSDNKVNILWANTEVMKPALFTRAGNPDVRRQFPKPGHDEKITKTAAIVMERSLVSCISHFDFTGEIEAAIENMLLPGRGTCWIELDVNENSKSVKTVHVDWKDFRHGSAKRWNNVPWVARKHLFSKDDIKREFEEFEDRISYTATDADFKKADKDGTDAGKRAEVWEIWDKASKTRIYVSEGCDVILKVDDDPYRLQDFFPCPKPLFAITTTSTLVPRPEFALYQDQANELDHINDRISELTEQLKYCGVYDKNTQDAETLANIGQLKDGQFLPFAGASYIAERGGISAAFMVRDLTPIITTLEGLHVQRDKTLQTIYELTGISDILRGQGQEYETAAAQEIKARAGSQRFDRKKRAVQDFIRELMRMMVEIMSEHFSREQLEIMTGISMPTAAKRDQIRQLLAMGAQAQAAKAQAQQMASNPQIAQAAQQNPQMAAAAMQMLPQDPLAHLPPEAVAEMQALANAVSWEEISEIIRSDDRRNYSINVETDITAFENSETEKAQRMEFVSTIQSLLQTSIPAMQQAPALGPMVKETILFISKSFKVGRQLEDTIETTMDQLMKMPPAPATQDPLIELERKKLEQDAQLTQIKIAKEQKLAELAVQEAQINLQLKQKEIEMQIAVLSQKNETTALDMQNKAMDARIKELELELKKLKIYEQERAPTIEVPLG
jgi:hypothetical protein